MLMLSLIEFPLELGEDAIISLFVIMFVEIEPVEVELGIDVADVADSVEVRKAEEPDIAEVCDAGFSVDIVEDIVGARGVDVVVDVVGGVADVVGAGFREVVFEVNLVSVSLVELPIVEGEFEVA